jgi:hypothetical protein
MWRASFWIHAERLPWELGADFFFRHLLDADDTATSLTESARSHHLAEVVAFAPRRVRSAIPSRGFPVGSTLRESVSPSSSALRMRSRSSSQAPGLFPSVKRWTFTFACLPWRERR